MRNAAGRRTDPLAELTQPTQPDVDTGGTLGSVGVALTIVGLGFAVPLLIASHYGALGIARSDDWSYLVTLFRWVDHGRLSFNHWVSMTLIGQLALTAPVIAVFGRSITVAQVTAAALGTLGLGAVVIAARRSPLPRWTAALIAASIAVGPLWGPLAASFMTDVPAFALSSIAVACGVESLRSRASANRWLVASLATGFVAFTIRQYAIVPALAIVATHCWSAMAEGDRLRARRVAVGGALVVVAAVLVLGWWRTVPDVRSLTPALPTAHALSSTVIKGAGFLRLSGLLLLPVLVVARPGTLVRRSWDASAPLTSIVTAGATMWLAITGLFVHNDLFVGNYVIRDGVLSDIVTIGPRPDVFPSVVWLTIVLVASVAGVVLAVALVPWLFGLVQRVRTRDWRPRRPIESFLVLVVLGYVATLVLAVMTGLQVYDRYLLPVLPAAGILLAHRRVAPSSTTADRRSRIATVVALVALTVVGISFTAESASFDGARWRVAVAATRSGWRPMEVNGGFEWLNYHRGDRGTPASVRRQRICVTVHVDPSVPAGRVVASVESTAPTRRDTRIVAYRTDVPCRTPRRSARP